MIQQLKELIGRKFAYKDKEILIKNVKKVSGAYVFITDKRTYNFFESEIPFFLKEIYELPKIKFKEQQLEKIKMVTNEKKEEIKTDEVVVDTNINLDIKQILIDAVEKVRIDKSYIGQANAICNIVTQMINIQKLEIQLKKNK